MNNNNNNNNSGNKKDGNDPSSASTDTPSERVLHFTGGLGERKPELDVGEMEGISFKVEPLRRSGEDPSTMKARLLC